VLNQFLNFVVAITGYGMATLNQCYHQNVNAIAHLQIGLLRMFT
jgi:hypothetical protein